MRDERLAPLELAPEMGSLDCGTINFGDRIFEGDVPFLRRMAEAFRDHGVAPELECFDTGHVGLALQLREEGLLDDPLRVQFVLGIPGTGVPASFAQVEHMRALLPAGAPWSVCAIGRDQLPMNAYCLIAGGHVRTGPGGQPAPRRAACARRTPRSSSASYAWRASSAGRSRRVEQAREILALLQSSCSRASARAGGAPARR